MSDHVRLVHCRIGSLEVTNAVREASTQVHCRIGSLEVTHHEATRYALVHCRIGSLEGYGGLFIVL